MKTQYPTGEENTENKIKVQRTESAMLGTNNRLLNSDCMKRNNGILGKLLDNGIVICSGAL